MNHLYSDLKPGNRIDKLFVDFILPSVEKHGFKYLKSKRQFKRKPDFFEHHISWRGRKYNEGNKSVQFDIFINTFSPQYRKWETEFYDLEKNWGNSIDGTRVDYINGWDKEFYENGWYDLVKFDNDKVMKRILENIESAGFNFFNHYVDFDSAIEELKKHHVKNFEIIVDFYLIQNKYMEAIDFFEKNNSWHEDRLRSDKYEFHTQFLDNRKEPYLKRKEKLSEWIQQNL